MVNFPMGCAESSVWCGCLESTVFGHTWGGAARLLTAPENTTHHRAAHRSPSVLRLDTNYQLREWERGNHSGIYFCTGLEANLAERLKQWNCPEDFCSLIFKKRVIWSTFLSCKRWILHFLFKAFHFPTLVNLEVKQANGTANKIRFCKLKTDFNSDLSKQGNYIY